MFFATIYPNLLQKHTNNTNPDWAYLQYTNTSIINQN